MHPSDDELLDLALSRGEPDARENVHVRGCPDCAARYAAVLAEQDLLRAALGSPETAAARPQRRRRDHRWAVAAALLLGILTGVAVSRPLSPRRPSRSPVAFEQAESALRQIPAAIEVLRDADPARIDREFPRVLSRAEGLYGEFLEAYLDAASPLTEAQRAELRQAVDTMYASVWAQDDASKPAGAFQTALKAALNPEQYEAYQARARLDRESGWEAEIDLVTDDLAEALNLRHSEEDGIRNALRARYPKSDLPRLPLAQWPPDRLADDAELAAAIRASLAAAYHPAFEKYVEELRGDHRRAEQAARAFSAGQGR